jgi:hypothetical protein
MYDVKSQRIILFIATRMRTSAVQIASPTDIVVRITTVQNEI